MDCVGGLLLDERKPKIQLSSGHKKKSSNHLATAPNNILTYINVLMCVEMNPGELCQGKAMKMTHVII